MLTGTQKALLKQAQREAGLDDTEYREAIGTVLPGASSSTDPRISDGHLDRLLAYFEAICWRKRDAKEPGLLRARVFRARGYWARKNTAENTSRDRYTGGRLAAQIAEAEAAVRAMGKPDTYLAAIRAKTGNGWPYLHALKRTAKPKVITAKTPPAPTPQPACNQHFKPVRTYQLKPI